MQPLAPDAPVLILLPGLTGGSDDSYVRCATHHCVSALSELRLQLSVRRLLSRCCHRYAVQYADAHGVSAGHIDKSTLLPQIRRAIC